MTSVSSPYAAGCPKRMVYGPCGGVRSHDRCEMVDDPCVFIGDSAALPGWPSPRAEASRAVAVPRVLTDLSAPPADAKTLTATAQRLADSCDAVLVGDHQDRVDFSPSMLARLIRDAGVAPWVTLACRDRNRVSLEQELQSLRLDDRVTVLCVTGDGRAFDVRPEVTQAFDLDGTRLAALAAALGLPVGVAETPTAAPARWRPARLVEKQRAGADVAVLNHVPDHHQVAHFVAAARQAGLVIPVLASVSVFTDERSAAVLAALPGLALDREVVRLVLGAADPIAAGIEAAVREAAALLAIEGVAGVNLSGLVSARGVAEAAAIQAEIGHRIRALP